MYVWEEGAFNIGSFLLGKAASISSQLPLRYRMNCEESRRRIATESKVFNRPVSLNY